MPLPLFRFPYLCQKKIVRSMDLFEVIRLSTINKRVKRVLDACEYPINRWEWLDTDLIELTIRNKAVVFKILPKKVTTEPEVYPLKLNAENIILRIKKRNSAKEYTFVVECATKIRKTEKAKLRLNEMISRHCLSFIKPQSFIVGWWKARIRPDNLFMFDLSKTFSQVCMFPSTENKFFSVSPETIERLMREINTEFMSLEIRCATEDFRYQNTSNGVLKIRKLFLKSSDFIQFDNFIKHLNLPKLSCPAPSTTTMNAILKEWVGGENKFVEYLELFDEEKVNLNIEEVLAGLSHSETRLKSNQFKSLTEEKYDFEGFRPDFFENGVPDPIYAYDVKRDRDGQEATIVFLRHHVTLHVWTDEHMAKIHNIHD